MISSDRFAITVQIIIPLPSTSIDMSLWIYILHGYDLEADTADLPYRVTPELTQAKQDGGRQKEKGREKERDRDSQSEYSWSRKISTDCALARAHAHPHAHVCKERRF